MSLVIEVPGWRRLVLEHLVLDLNGTLAADGALAPGVAQAVERLGGILTCHLVTADTFGTAARLFGPTVRLALIRPGDEAAQKREVVRRLGALGVAAVGNGANDVLMLKEAALGIAVLGAEGASPRALNAAQVVVREPVEALELLLKPDRLRATLRR